MVDSKDEIAIRQKRRAQVLFVSMLVSLLITVALFFFLHGYSGIPANQEESDGTPAAAVEGQQDTNSAQASGEAETGDQAGGEAETGDQAGSQAESVLTNQQDTPDPERNFLLRWVDPPWQYLDWLIAALAGVLLYTLVNVAHFYHQSFPNGKFRESGRSGDFISFTPWYISTIIRGPLVAVAILLFLTNVNIEISGIELNFSTLSATMLIFMAFILGFYSRVARNQLDQIVKTVFKHAYSRAEERFSIQPRRYQMSPGEAKEFRTSPTTEVNWMVDGPGEIGANGKFEAPADGTDLEGKITQIIAIPRDDSIPRSTATVTFTLKDKVSIVAPAEIVEVSGRKQTTAQEADLKFATDPQDTVVDWVVREGGAVFSEENPGQLTLPEIAAETRIIVAAEPKAENSRLKNSDDFVFYLLPELPAEPAPGESIEPDVVEEVVEPQAEVQPADMAESGEAVGDQAAAGSGASAAEGGG